MRLILGLVFVLLIMVGISCKSSKATSENEVQSDIPEQFQGKVLVSLLSGIEPKELEIDFAKYSLTHLSFASRSQNQHLFKFDADKISTEDILKKLNKSKKVYAAEALEYQLEKPKLMTSDKKGKADVK
jgi:hypothetical protein